MDNIFELLTYDRYLEEREYYNTRGWLDFSSFESYLEWLIEFENEYYNEPFNNGLEIEIENINDELLCPRC